MKVDKLEPFLDVVGFLPQRAVQFDVPPPEVLGVRLAPADSGTREDVVAAILIGRDLREVRGLDQAGHGSVVGALLVFESVNLFGRRLLAGQSDEIGLFIFLVDVGARSGFAQCSRGCARPQVQTFRRLVGQMAQRRRVNVSWGLHR